MAQDPATNEARFGAILQALKYCDLIEDKFNAISQESSAINQGESNGFNDIIEHANDIAALLEVTSLKGEQYEALLNQSNDLERIVYLTSKLQECVDDKAKFDEATELLELADHLYKNHGHQYPLIETIHRESEKQREYLIANLCDRLSELKETSGDELKTIVNRLIRCGQFSARELRLRYLQARDSWFNDECDSKSDSSDELISFFCRGLPQVFEEYKSIFSDSNPLAVSAMMMSVTDSTKEGGAIINSWLLLKTSTFIVSLEIHLKTMSKSKLLTPTMISDIMLKCFKLTDWLASIGFDFSSQLRPLFAQTISEEVKTSIESVSTKFESDFTKIISQSIESLLLPVEDEILRISNLAKPEEQLPKSICHYPIFKIYCLYLIDSLRWIQTTKSVLSPMSLSLDTYGALNSSLTRIMKALAVVLNLDNNSNHPILSKIAISFLTEVLPFFSNYCELLFPEKVILSAIGMSKTEFKSICAREPHKLRNFCLDLRQIGDPLRGTMPALMQAIEG